MRQNRGGAAPPQGMNSKTPSSKSQPISTPARSGASRNPRTPSSSQLRKQQSCNTPQSYINLSLSSLAISSQEPKSDLVDSRDILIVSENITHWQILFRNLSQPQDVSNRIAQIEADNRNVKTQEVCAKVLEIWQRERGNEARYRVLVDSLYKMKRKDVVDTLNIARGRNNQSLSQMLSFPSTMSSSVSSFLDLASGAFGEDYEDEESFFTGQTPFEKFPKEVNRIIDALKNPNITVISLAGPQKSGKTVTLTILEKKLEEIAPPPMRMTKIIKIRSTSQIDSQWLSRKVVEGIQKQSRSESDQSAFAVSNMVGLLDSYEEIVLILDISLNAFSPNGIKIIEFLLKLRKNEQLSKRLRIVISTMTSLWKTSLFLQDRKAFEEIVVQPLGYREAVEYIRELNPTFSKQVASTLVTKIDCYPFYLRQIAEADIENIFVVEGKEDTIRSIESQFEELNALLFDPDVEEAVSAVFTCLDKDKQALLTQVLTFANRFGLEQAQRIVDHKIDINDSLFNPLCEQGALFLKRNRTKSKVIVYRIPKIQGDILRTILNKNEQLSEMYHKALTKHQTLYLELLVLLSDCFMGDPPSKAEELRVLEPFTPSDGVPAHQSLTIEDANERTSRVVALFRQQHDDIMKSLLYCNISQENYKAVIDGITQLNVYYFLTYMLCSHESLKIYRKLKREAKSQQDQNSLVKLNVFIASLSIDANGQNKYLSEANSLYEASAPSLQGDVLGHCLQRIAANMLSEGLLFGNLEKKKSVIWDNVKKAKEVFEENNNQKKATEIYIVDCSRLMAGIFNAYSMDQDFPTLLSKCSEILGSRHPITCSMSKIQGIRHQNGGDFHSAKKIFYEVLDAEEDFLGQHWQTSRTLFQLAMCLHEEMKESSEKKQLDLNENRANGSTTDGQLNQKDQLIQEVGVEVQEENDEASFTQEAEVVSNGDVRQHQNQQQKQQQQQQQQHQGHVFVVGDGNEVEHQRAMDCTLVCLCGTKPCSERFKKDTLCVKNGAKPRYGNAEEMHQERSQNVQFQRLYSSSSNSTVDMTSFNQENPAERIKNNGKIGDGGMDEVKHLLKRAAGYALHANGRCDDARSCFLKLSEISAQIRDNEAAKKYAKKAMQCADTT